MGGAKVENLIEIQPILSFTDRETESRDAWNLPSKKMGKRIGQCKWKISET